MRGGQSARPSSCPRSKPAASRPITGKAVSGSAFVSRTVRWRRSDTSSAVSAQESISRNRPSEAHQICSPVSVLIAVRANVHPNIQNGSAKPGSNILPRMDFADGGDAHRGAIHGARLDLRAEARWDPDARVQ